MLQYSNNQLQLEGVLLSDIAKKVSTPFYAYSKRKILKQYQNFSKAFAGVDHKICYAIKANCNINIINLFANLGAGADAVSYGEIWKSIKSGIDPKKIVFAGVGKTATEIKSALNDGVYHFSIESESELRLISKIAADINKVAKISVRVNPNVDARTHDKISTGRKGDKFGIDIEEAPSIYQVARNLPNLEIHGIATHIGSQLTNLEPFQKAFLKIRELFLGLTKEGFIIKDLDLGGGVGITYDDEVEISIFDYATMIKQVFNGLPISFTFAPGRYLMGNSGVIISEIIHIKKTSHKNFVIIDMAMNDLMRPGLYDAYHKIVPIVEKFQGVDEAFDIVGPICESTDILAKKRILKMPKAGDLLAFCSAGAYGSSMSNQYNSRPLVPEVLLDGDIFKIIRKRPTYEEMIRFEKI